MGRIFAGTLGLLAFVTILARGLIHNSAGGRLMLHAAAAMFIFAALGWIAGRIAETTIVQAVRRQFDIEMESARADAGESAS